MAPELREAPGTKTGVPAESSVASGAPRGTDPSLAPLPPHISDSPLTPLFSECGLAVGVAAGLGQGEWGHRGYVTQGPGGDPLSLLSRKQMQTVGIRGSGFAFGESLLHVPAAGPLIPTPIQGPSTVRPGHRGVWAPLTGPAGRLQLSQAFEGGATPAARHPGPPHRHLLC